LVPVAGDAQEAVVGTAVPTAPAVQVVDAAATPIAGATVTFAVVSGGGSVTGSSAVTNASGVATVGRWTLGTTVGINTLAASVGPLSRTFTAMGNGGPPAALAKAGGDAQVAPAGTTLPALLQVRVTDANGNPVSGVAVSFAVTSGGGHLAASVATVTNVNGIIVPGGWTLGTTAGSNTVTATLGALSVTFTATGT
jgi:adhesin/invasin